MQAGLVKWVLGVFAVSALLVWAGLGAQNGPGRAAARSGAEAGPSISVTGTAQAAVPQGIQSIVLTIGVQERAKADSVGKAVATVQERVARVQEALQQAGIAEASIQAASIALSPVYSRAPPAQGAEASLPAAPGLVQAYDVSQTVVVEANGHEELIAAMQAAADVGAASANFANRTYKSIVPDASLLDAAIKQATERAARMAQATAKSGGLSLGPVRSVTVKPATFVSGGPGTSFWQVDVDLSYGTEVAAASPR